MLQNLLHEGFIRGKDDLSRKFATPYLCPPKPPLTSHFHTKQYHASLQLCSLHIGITSV